MNNFCDLDCREYVIGRGYKYEVTMRQIDLLRLYKILIALQSLKLAEKIRRIIAIRDFNEGTITDFNRILPKRDIEQYLMSPRDYVEYKQNQRVLDKQLSDYYAQANTRKIK